MEKIKCPHMKYLYPLKDAKLKNSYLIRNTEKGLFKCLMCLKTSSRVWLCLNDNCLFLGCEKSEKDHIQAHLDEMKEYEHNDPHCIYFNAHTLQIYCFACNVEIWDFEMVSVEVKPDTQGENVTNPSKIRDALKVYLGIMKGNSIKLTTAMKNTKINKKNKGVCGLINLGNTSHINSMIQMLSHIPSIRNFYKALHSRMENSINLPAKSTKKFSYLLAGLINELWSGEYRVCKPSEAVIALFDLQPILRGYGSQDVQETFRFFINIIHEEHRILIGKNYELGVKPIINKQQNNDEWNIINNLFEYLENSIITDTFQGKMISNFKCEKCNEELSLDDYFTYLELKIPKARDTNKLRRWKINLENVGDKESAQIYNNSKNGSFHIYEVLGDFFDTKFIRPFGNLYCEKCQDKTPYRKFYRFLNMPNILSLQIKRKGVPANENLKVVVPVDNFTVEPFLTKDGNYSQEQTSYELLGYIENRGTESRPNYVAVVKHYKTGEWHVLDDHEISSIDEKSVMENNATIILYKKKMDEYQIKTMNNLKSQVKLLKKQIVVMKDQELSYIPNYWYEKSISLATPGMMHTCHLFCKHGRIKPSYFDCFPLKKGSNPNSSMLSASMLDNSVGMERSFVNLEGTDEFGAYTKNFIERQSVKLPRPLAEFFLEKYGGGPLINEIDICDDCTSEAIIVKRRKRIEREAISRFDSKKTNAMYAVSQEWTQAWKNFLYINNRFLRRNFIKGHAPPGPINNTPLLEADGVTPKPNLIKNTHYRMVNEYIWKLFVELYGGGPAIKRIGKDIYTGTAEENYPEIKFSEEDKYNIEELKSMLSSQDSIEEKKEVFSMNKFDFKGEEEEEKNGEKQLDSEYSNPDHDSEEPSSNESPKLRNIEADEKQEKLKINGDGSTESEIIKVDPVVVNIEEVKTAAEISFRPYTQEIPTVIINSESNIAETASEPKIETVGSLSSDPKSPALKEPPSPKEKLSGSPGHKRSKVPLGKSSPDKRKDSYSSPGKLTLQHDEKIDLQNTRNSPALKSLSSKSHINEEEPELFNLDQIQETEGTDRVENQEAVEENKEKNAAEFQEPVKNEDVEISTKVESETSPEEKKLEINLEQKNSE